MRIIEKKIIKKNEKKNKNKIITRLCTSNLLTILMKFIKIILSINMQR